METVTETATETQKITINFTEEQFIKLIDTNRLDNSVKQLCWFEMCNNPNINVLEFIEKTNSKSFYFENLSKDHWIELCGKEHLTEFLTQHSYTLLNIEYIGNTYIGNTCLAEMCKTKNNLCIVKKYLKKLTKEHWVILFKNEHAMDLVKTKVEEIKSLIKELTYNPNPEINNFIEDITQL